MCTSLTPADVIGAAEVFGQHELAELSGDSDSIAELIMRFNGSIGEDPALEDVRKRLRQNREELRKAEEAKVELEEELAQAGRLEEQLDRYKGTDVPGKLRGHERIALDQAVFTEGTSRIAAARALLDQYRKSASLTNLDAVIDNIEGVPQTERLSRVKTALEGLRRELEELGEQAAAAIDTAQSEIQAAQADWEAAIGVEREGYGEVLRSLAEEA